MDFMTVNLKMSDEVTAMLEDRGILESDVREALAYAEGEGIKLYQEGSNRCLGKKRLGNFTVYVEYECADDSVEIFDVYSHRVMLKEDGE
jgi:hypothetical protein